MVLIRNIRIIQGGAKHAKWKGLQSDFEGDVVY
mgnify:CR=1 FL=1